MDYMFIRYFYTLKLLTDAEFSELEFPPD